MKNQGAVAGSQVAQLYVTYPDLGITSPHLQLKGFAKARDLAPGSSQELDIRLDKYAFSYWDADKNAWAAPAGTYVLHVGSSSDELVLEHSFELRKTFRWSGL